MSKWSEARAEAQAKAKEFASKSKAERAYEVWTGKNMNTAGKLVWGVVGDLVDLFAPSLGQKLHSAKNLEEVIDATREISKVQVDLESYDAETQKQYNKLISESNRLLDKLNEARAAQREYGSQHVNEAVEKERSRVKKDLAEAYENKVKEADGLHQSRQDDAERKKLVSDLEKANLIASTAGQASGVFKESNYQKNKDAITASYKEETV